MPSAKGRTPGMTSPTVYACVNHAKDLLPIHQHLPLLQTRQTPERQSAAGWKQRKAVAKQLVQSALHHPALPAQVSAGFPIATEGLHLFERMSHACHQRLMHTMHSTLSVPAAQAHCMPSAGLAVSAAADAVHGPPVLAPLSTKVPQRSPPAAGAKTAGSAGAKAKAKEDVKGSVGRKQEGGRRQEGGAAAGGGSPKPVHAELGGLRMGGGGGGGGSTGESLTPQPMVPTACEPPLAMLGEDLQAD